MTIEEVFEALDIRPIIGVNTYKEAESLMSILEQEGHRGLEIKEVWWGEDGYTYTVEQTYNLYHEPKR